MAPELCYVSDSLQIKNITLSLENVKWNCYRYSTEEGMNGREDAQNEKGRLINTTENELILVFFNC